MDALFDALYTQLNGDATLGTLLSSVRSFRRPEDPQKLIAPVLVFNPAPGSDEVGLHGAATNISIEFNIWGYQHDAIDMFPDCVRAGQRVHELLIANKLTLSRGGHVRWNAETTFHQVPQDDPDVILLRADYGTRYWSGSTIDEIISQ